MPDMTIDQAMQAAVRHHQAGRWHDAELIYRAVLAKNPNQVDALNLLGVIADHAGHHGDAAELIGRAIAISPGEAILHVNLSVAMSNLGRFDQSVAVLKTAFALNPNLPATTHQDLAKLLLLQGKFSEAWPMHERWRDKTGQFAGENQLKQPEWKGEDVNGKTLLVYSEQGLGDAIQFVRYVPLIAARGATVITGCYDLLKRIFSACPEFGRVLSSVEPSERFDYHCSMLSLPAVFGTDLQSIPASVPYLRAEPELVRQWSQRLGPPDGRLRVGLVWAGQPAHLNDRRRSITLAQLAPLAKMPGVQFYSLQKGPAAAQAVNPPACMQLINLTNHITDLADTAAIMCNLDLVIGVDTGPMHLAGALGRPAWMLLPLLPDFRWLIDREDSPWYPTLRLFRQQTGGDWSEPIARIAEALAEFRK